MALSDPAAAHHDLPIVEYGCLAGRDGALTLIKGDQALVVASPLHHCGCRLVAMANLHSDPHGRVEIVHRDQIHAAGPQRARIEMLFPADHDLLVRAADLDNVERRACGHAQSLTLTHGEIVNASMFADHFTTGSDKIAGCVR